MGQIEVEASLESVGLYYISSLTLDTHSCYPSSQPNVVLHRSVFDTSKLV